MQCSRTSKDQFQTCRLLPLPTPLLPCSLPRPSNTLQTARGEGLQQEVEWLAYASLLRNLSAAGVPEQLVWDVPGTLSVLLLLGLGHSTHADPGCTRSTTCS